VSERPTPAFLDALRAFHDALNELGAPFAFIGGVAVIARGVPRLTVDIDATVRAADTDVESVFQALGRHEIRPRIEEAREFARIHQVFLALHEPTGTPIDLVWRGSISRTRPSNRAARSTTPTCESR
jgi:hypothetical protein